MLSGIVTLSVVVVVEIVVVLGTINVHIKYHISWAQGSLEKMLHYKCLIMLSMVIIC